jgi:molybdopterin-guanine dinucleotide biosynthesis protein MobB
MPQIVSIIGESKSGKTTLIEKLISELKSRGYRVATVKHSVHMLNFDKTGKDSWRHLQAGSVVTAIVSPDQVIMIKPVSKEPGLKEIARLFDNEYDIILTEGFKDSAAPKIEVRRKASGPPLSGIKNIVAIATDEPLETSTRQFPLNDVKAIADFLERVYIEVR